MHTHFSTAPYFRPYLWAGPEFQIGLQPITARGWLLVDEDYAVFMRAKRAHLARSPSVYYKTLPSSLAAQNELRELVAANLAAHHPNLFTLSGSVLTSLTDGHTLDLQDDSDEALMQISRFVQEDFMLIQEIDGQQTITAAANPYSSSGRLVASVGHGLKWAHEPVPQLTAIHGPRIDRIIASVHESTPCARFNWQLTPLSSIFFPPDPHAANRSALESVQLQLRSNPALAGQLLNIRVERQTLSRLPATRAVAFSIHTYTDPLASIAKDPDSVKGILALLRRYSKPRLQYSEMDGIHDSVIAWLEQLIAEKV